jgi:hypothetical protein
MDTSRYQQAIEFSEVRVGAEIAHGVAQCQRTRTRQHRIGVTSTDDSLRSPIAATTSRGHYLPQCQLAIESPKRVGMTFTAVGVPLDPIDQACFLNSSTRTRVFSL